MAGREGARGYVYQAIIAVLNCLEEDSWDQIKVEPLTRHDKVDIILKKSGMVTKAIQVKSSVNKFERPEIENWLEDLCEDIESKKYELVLVGNEYTEPALKYIRKINKDSDYIQIKKVDFDEKTLLNSIKVNIIEFLERYNRLYAIDTYRIGNIAKCLLADLMLISTNEKFFDKEELIHLISRNIFYNKRYRSRINMIKKTFKVLTFLLWLFLSYDAAYGSILNSIFILLSDVFILILWGLMKYSDYYYRKNPDVEPFTYYSSENKFGLGCRFLKVEIVVNNILYEQEIDIKNILNEDILYLKGELKFYSLDQEEYCLEFEKRNIDANKSIRIDKITYESTVGFIEKTHWDEVILKIIKMETEKQKNIFWKGRIIKFYRIPNLNPIRYIQIGPIRILPYEMSWLYEKVVRKVGRKIYIFLHVKLGGYDLRNRWNNFKIKVTGFFKRWFYHIVGMIILLLCVGGILILIYGQYLVFYNILEYINSVFTEC